jgi:hypothetical protein
MADETSRRLRVGEDPEQTILRYVRLHNRPLPHSALQGRTPIDALQNWRRAKPDLHRTRHAILPDVAATKRISQGS